MRLLKTETTAEYKEIVVEKKFLIWKREITYRRYNRHIFKYKPNSDFYLLGVCEYFDIKPFFEITL